MIEFKAGWIPDSPDHRDIAYASIRERSLANKLFGAIALPRYVNLVESEPNGWPEVYNQGPVGSCVNQAWCAAIAHLEWKEGNTLELMSRLFMYYNARPDPSVDSGSTIRDGIKGVARHGVCLEQFWPHIPSMWTQRPSDVAFNDAATRKLPDDSVYAYLDGTDECVQCLAEGHPFVFGVSIYPEFQDLYGVNSTLQLPKGDVKSLGGHAMCAVGYDLPAKQFIVRNSWGTDWGNQGYFRMPFEYLVNLGSDQWMLKVIAK